MKRIWCITQVINVSWIAHFPWATLSDFIKHTRDWIVILMEVNFEGSCFAIHGLPYLRLNLKTIGGRCIADPISRDISIQKFCPTWDTLSTKVWERQYPAADREDRELHIIVHQLQRYRKHTHRQRHTNKGWFFSNAPLLFLYCNEQFLQFTGS